MITCTVAPVPEIAVMLARIYLQTLIDVLPLVAVVVPDKVYVSTVTQLELVPLNVAVSLEP
jgi:hypothetical protein